MQYLTLLAALLGLTICSAGVNAATLERVQQAGQLRCGIVVSQEDWNKEDLHGDLTSLHIEICKAIGVAALGEKVKVDVTPFNAEADAEQGLADARVDVVVGVTPTATAVARWHVTFGPPVFYDGLALLVHASVPGEKLADLGGRKVCVIDATDNDRLLEALASTASPKARIAPWQEESEMDDAMSTHWCDAVGAYVSRLVPLRNQYRQLAKARILPGMLTVAPVAPGYRSDDPAWGLVVDTTVRALVLAEELGLNQANVRAQKASDNPRVQHFEGVDWSTAAALGLLPRKDWAAQVIAVVGNYGEIYERTLGGNGAGIPRGLNALWTQGGLMHAGSVQ
jgi:general L-amino acid transport system substrate-binding protein